MCKRALQNFVIIFSSSLFNFSLFFFFDFFQIYTSTYFLVLSRAKGNIVTGRWLIIRMDMTRQCASGHGLIFSFSPPPSSYSLLLLVILVLMPLSINVNVRQPTWQSLARETERTSRVHRYIYVLYITFCVICLLALKQKELQRKIVTRLTLCVLYSHL